jgi:Domain of unknown function (DUF4411)
MRQDSSPTLFDTDKPKLLIYLVDTSAWFNIELRDDREHVWGIVYRLIGEQRIKVCPEVFGEIKGDPVYEKLRLREATLKIGLRTANDLEYLALIGEITHKYPRLCKARSRKRVADPYVIAQAELNGYVVVADESTKQPSRKIPGVCQKRHPPVPCIDLDQFVADNSSSAAAAS